MAARHEAFSALRAHADADRPVRATRTGFFAAARFLFYNSRMRRTLCTLITSILLVAALCPAVFAEDQRDNIRRTRQELLARQRQHYQQSLHGLPLLNEHRMIRIM